VGVGQHVISRADKLTIHCVVEIGLYGFYGMAILCIKMPSSAKVQINVGLCEIPFQDKPV